MRLQSRQRPRAQAGPLLRERARTHGYRSTGRRPARRSPAAARPALPSEALPPAERRTWNLRARARGLVAPDTRPDGPQIGRVSPSSEPRVPPVLCPVAPARPDDEVNHERRGQAPALLNRHGKPPCKRPRGRRDIHGGRTSRATARPGQRERRGTKSTTCPRFCRTFAARNPSQAGDSTGRLRTRRPVRSQLCYACCAFSRFLSRAEEVTASGRTTRGSCVSTPNASPGSTALT
jgi:hypothetical protein